MNLLKAIKSIRQELIPFKLFHDKMLKQSTLFAHGSPSDLDSLFLHHGTDKGCFKHNINGDSTQSRPGHNYSAIYLRLFNHCREHILKVFEFGVGSTNESIPFNMTSSGRPGASLRVWKSYFPNACIYGADIDESILFQEERIETFYVDQMNDSSIQNMWSKINSSNFDLIIDDGCHVFEAGLKSFQNSFGQLKKPGGIYVIEDVGNMRDLLSYQKYFDAHDHRYEISMLRTSEVGYLHSAMIIIYF